MKLSSITQRLGPALKRWRQLNRIKQSAFAADFGISQTTVSRWEAGEAPADKYLEKLSDLLCAKPTSAADRALCQLIQTSREPYFLICDTSHELLAVSPERRKEWHVPPAEMLGKSLWRFATPEIEAFETSLGDEGWYEAVAPVLTFSTRQAQFDELTIFEGTRSVVRMQLSDGRFARLISDV